MVCVGKTPSRKWVILIRVEAICYLSDDIPSPALLGKGRPGGGGSSIYEHVWWLWLERPGPPTPHMCLLILQQVGLLCAPTCAVVVQPPQLGALGLGTALMPGL